MAKFLYTLLLSLCFFSGSLYGQSSELLLEIIGGSDVKEGDYDSVVALNNCTGFVIHPHLVATAAHCIGGEGVNDSSFRFEIANTRRGKRKTSVRLKKIHIHPWYRKKSVYDIAFIETDENLQTELGIKSIPKFFIGTRESYLKLKSSKPIVTAVGYGKNEKGYSELKKYVLLNFKKFYLDIKNKRSVNLTNWTEYLAEQGVLPSSYVLSWLGADTCKGDSGGPGFINIDGEKLYLGLTVGGGNRCGKGKDPSVYRMIYPSICSFPDILNRYFKDRIGDSCRGVRYWVEEK